MSHKRRWWASRQRTIMKKGPLIIVSGPSGSGKSTVIRRVLAEGGLPLHLSVSATTRAKRKGEIDGSDYHFWSREQFEEQVAAGAFLEFAEVHGNLYGTLRSEVDNYRGAGHGVILDIDVQGAAAVRELYRDTLSIFLCTSNWEVYEQRLRRRGTEDEAGIARRLATARQELKHKRDFNQVVLNDDLDTAVAQVRGLVAGAFARGQSCSTS